MLHACAARFDVTGNLEKFWKLNKPKGNRFGPCPETRSGSCSICHWAKWARTSLARAICAVRRPRNQRETYPADTSTASVNREFVMRAQAVAQYCHSGTGTAASPSSVLALLPSACAPRAVADAVLPCNSLPLYPSLAGV